MKRAAEQAYSSQFGFVSPGFSVDKNGNIVANTITTNTEENTAEQEVYDFTVSDNGANFLFENQTQGITPELNLDKGKEYSFKLQLENFTWNLLEQDQETLYALGITHSLGVEGAAALNQSEGIFRLTIPIDYDQDQIFYSNFEQDVLGTINVLDPVGVFSTIEVTDGTEASDFDTASVLVAGGVAISKNLLVDSVLVDSQLLTDNITSNSVLDIDAQNKITLSIDGQSIGKIQTTGLEIPIVNSTINSTEIGQSVPDVAAFTSATVNEILNNENSITNKKYVDTRDIAFSIAFGL